MELFWRCRWKFHVADHQCPHTWRACAISLNASILRASDGASMAILWWKSSRCSALTETSRQSNFKCQHSIIQQSICAIRVVFEVKIIKYLESWTYFSEPFNCLWEAKLSFLACSLQSMRSVKRSSPSWCQGSLRFIKTRDPKFGTLASGWTPVKQEVSNQHFHW